MDPSNGVKSPRHDFAKRYCKRKMGNPLACPGDCMQCISEFIMFPGVEEM